MCNIFFPRNVIQNAINLFTICRDMSYKHLLFNTIHSFMTLRQYGNKCVYVLHVPSFALTTYLFPLCLNHTHLQNLFHDVHF